MARKRDFEPEDSFSAGILDFFEEKAHTIIFLAFSAIFIGIIFLLFYSASTSNKSEIVPTCGDGSFYGTCSLNKPFYCDNGTIFEKAGFCGCDNGLTKSGDSCKSQYQTSPKNIALKYFLRGEEHELNFTLYGGMYGYIQNFSDEISYKDGEKSFRTDFKLKNINEPNQRALLLPLAAEIQNAAHDENDQMRIAISIVQNLQWGNSNRSVKFFGTTFTYSRHPYEVLYDSEGVCGEKSELLALLLKELGYNAAIFYNQEENHESVGIKCPADKSWKGTGYCFVETTGNSVMTDSSIEYTNGLRINSEPQVMVISDGKSLPDNLYEYGDAKYMMKIRSDLSNGGRIINPFRIWKYDELKRKYNLPDSYNIG